MYRPLFSALPVKRGASVVSASLLLPSGTSSRAFSHIPATAYMTSMLASSSSSSSPSFRYKSPVGVYDLLRRSNSQNSQASLFTGMHTALPHTATPRAYSTSRSFAFVRRFNPPSTGLYSGSRPISSRVSSFFSAVRKQPESCHVNRSSVRTAQKYLSTTTLACMRVGGKPSNGSGNSFIEKIYPVTKSSSSGNGGREREMDALTPHVREHLFRVYSLLGATVVAAGLGSALMILTPLCQVIPGWLPLVGGFVPLLWLSFAPPADPTLKTALLLSFGLLEGMAIAPLVLMSSMKSVLVTSLALTGAIFGGFSAAAYLAPRASMLMLQGPLFGGLIGLMVLSMISLFYPTAIAHSLILYGGLALFSVMIAADTQAMIERARCGVGDHVSDAMQMFLSLINIFIRIMQIMGKD